MITREAAAAKIRPICLKYKNLLNRVILFGSYSRGEQTEHSDIDLYIESPHTTGKALTSRDFRNFEYDLHDAFDNLLSFDLLLFGGKRDLAQVQKSPLYQQISKDGVLLYDKSSETV